MENDVEFDWLVKESEEPAPKSSGSHEDTPLYALVLTPTRELAIQVKEHIDNAAKYTGIKV